MSTGKMTENNWLSVLLPGKSLSQERPYVWQLGITAEDFARLEEALKASIAEHHGSHAHLLCRANASAALVYLGEWYKRNYTGTARNDTIAFTSDELRRLWEAAGFSIEKFVYCKADGSHLWQYSTYVLGGLAMRLEMRKTDNRLLKSLCHLYYGEEYSVDNLAENEERAIAFRESIRHHHSLYYFIKDALEDKLDISDPLTAQFVVQVKNANQEVLRDKFRLNWLVECQFGDQMRRRLRISLRPEESGGKLRQYIRYSRAIAWGIAHPEKQRRLRFGVSFWDGGTELQKTDLAHPLLVCVNTGGDEVFLAQGVNRATEFADVPVQHFDQIKFFVAGDDDVPIVIQKLPVPEYLQLWMEDQWLDLWIDRNSIQRATAVLFSDDCQLMSPQDKEDIHLRKRYFIDSTQCQSAPYSWCTFANELRIQTADGRTQTFYNRTGIDQIVCQTYPQCIRYHEQGTVRLISDEDEELIPVLFRRDDVLVRHSEIRDGVEKILLERAENVEFKGNSGRYEMWEGTARPPLGRITLRAIVKGKEYHLAAFFLPSLLDKGEKTPVVRDCVKNRIRYMNGKDGENHVLQDSFDQNGEALNPIRTLRMGTDDSYVELEVYRPVSRREIILDDKLFTEAGDRFRLPYLFKDRVAIHEFSEKGYSEFACSSLQGFYRRIGFDMAGAQLEFWKNGQCVPARDLCPEAPDWLDIVLGNPQNHPDQNATFLYWDYSENEPKEVPLNFDNMAGKGILFQDMRQMRPHLSNTYPRQPDSAESLDDIWEAFDNGADSVPSPDDEECALRCFLVAQKYRQYFFIFEPLYRLFHDTPQEVVARLFQPLKKARGEIFFLQDVEALRRLGEECNFDWAAAGINLETLQVIKS